MENKVKVLQEVVERNKLKDSGNNIDEMVQFLRDNGIAARYCSPQKK